MTLDDMCRMAARCTDRYDELIKTLMPDGTCRYTGEAENCFNILRDGINEAYAEISRTRLVPDRFVCLTVPDSRVISLTETLPDAASVCGVYSPDRKTRYAHRFLTRFELEIPDAEPGSTVLARIHYLPEPLRLETDEPVFPDSLVDPMTYVSLAAARMWQSERKFAAAQSWMNEYYRLLRRVRPSAADPTGRRFPRPVFR